MATTCLSFPQNDVNNFIVGSEEGTLYTACRHGSRAGILDLFEGHQVSSSRLPLAVELPIPSAGWLADRWVLLSSHVIGRYQDVENITCLFKAVIKSLHTLLLRFGFHINALKSHWVLGFRKMISPVHGRYRIQRAHTSYCMVQYFFLSRLNFPIVH